MPGTLVIGSAAREDDVVALGAEHLDDRIAMIALQLDDPLLGRAADAAALLEPAGQRLQPGVVQRDVRHGRDRLAAPAGGLAPHLHAPAALQPRLDLRIACLAQIPVAAGPDDLRVTPLGHGRDASADGARWGSAGRK